MPRALPGILTGTILAMARVEIQLGSRLMLVSLDRGMHVRQSLTDEVERLSAAVRRLPSPTVEAEASFWTLIDDVEEACAALRGTPAEFTPGGIQNAITVARSWVENARLRVGPSQPNWRARKRSASPPR